MNGVKVVEDGNVIYLLLAKLVEEKQGDLEEIRAAQFQFNESARLAHAEIVGLPSNTALQRTSRCNAVLKSYT